MDYLQLLILGMLTLEFGVASVLSWLNRRWMNHEMSEQVAGIYDAVTYARQQSYQQENDRLNGVVRALDFVVSFGLLALGVFGWYYGLCVKWLGNIYWATNFFLATCLLLSQMVDVPFSYYSVFVIEEKYGFNKSSKKRFAADQVKSSLLSLVVTIAVCDLIYYIYEMVGDALWIWGSLACMVIVIIFTSLYSVAIVPLFNRQTPLESGELRDSIADAARQVGFRIKNIYVIDGSKRSTKANAYFTGFGPQKRVVLYDTLIAQLSTREIVAVLMHEIGHYRHHDIIKSISQSVVQIAIYFYVFAMLLSSTACSSAMGYGGWSFALSLLAFLLLMTPVDIIMSPILNGLSRRAELQADSFAATAGYGPDLISALKKLSSQSLTNLTPHPLYVWFHYSHPTLADRIININDKISK